MSTTTTDEVKTKPKPATTLAEALVAAQSEMPAVEPDGVNPHFRSKFVTLGHLIAKTRPVLNRHGLAITQFPTRDPDGTPTLLTILMHRSGERLEFSAPLLLPKQDPQGQGSALTYMRRYALASVLGISDQEDDDGNGASGEKTKGKAETNGKPKHISKTDADGLRDAVKASGIKVNEVQVKLTALGVSKLDELTADQADELFAWMQDVEVKA